GMNPRHLLALLREQSWGSVLIEDTHVDMRRRRDLYASLLVAAKSKGPRWLLTSTEDSMTAETLGRVGTAFSLIPRLLHEGGSTLSGLWGAKRLTAKLDRDQPATLSPFSEKSEKRIAYLKTDFWFDVKAGGSISHAMGVLNGMQKAGWTPRIWTTTKIPALPDSISQTVVDPKPRPSIIEEAALAAYNRHYINAVRDEIKAFNPDILYQRHGVFSVVGVALAQELGLPLVMEVNGSEVWVKEAWSRLYFGDLARKMERVVFEKASRLVLISKALEPTIEELGGSPDRMVVSPNGVDVTRFDPQGNFDKERNELGFGSGDVVCGFVGTFHKWHGVLFLAEQITDLCRANPNLRFLFVGDGDFKPEIEQMLASEVKEGRVAFTGLVSPGRISKLLGACDVLLSPHLPFEDGTEFFGSPTKLFEYLASGRPVVASRLGQIGDVVDHEETGILIEPGNAAALRAAIQKLASDPLLRDRLGKAAREKAEQDYTWETNVRRALGGIGPQEPFVGRSF
ncbi:MAG: glycosyltransferase family 4 protein, partial [Candidatus Eisenbacteria bacterium]|nr:glycosyltransferase family 4 protein [Candidatus Eisenbacteria bacterium]